MEFKVTHHPDPALVEHFADLKQPREKGIFIAEGEKIVTRLLDTDMEIIALYLTQEHFEGKKHLIEVHRQDDRADIFIASKKSMERIVGFTLHQGILAAAKIPQELSLDSIIEQSAHPQLFVVVNTIADAENMGTIYRTALAAGATAVIMDERSVSPWIRRAVRVSMGAVFRLPTITVQDLAKTIGDLTRKGTQTFAAAITKDAIPSWSADFSGDLAIIFGSEGYGIEERLMAICTAKVMIPMHQNVDSFNVGIAQGMILYEVMRQRASG